MTVDKLISSDYELSQFIIDSLEKKNLCVVSDWNQDIYLVLKNDLVNQDRDLFNTIGEALNRSKEENELHYTNNLDYLEYHMD